MATGTWESQIAARPALPVGSSSSEVSPPKPAWYYEGLEDLDESVKKFFAEYTDTKPEKVVSHIEQWREKAYTIHPYPCIGAYRFLYNTIADNPLYPSLVGQLKADPSARFLDVACCLGQEGRRLTYDGVPSRQLLGTDIVPGFFDVGYEMFRDRDHFEGRFFRADMLDANDLELNALSGSVDAVFAGAFLHLFPYQVQLKLLIRIIGLLKPKPGVKILGRQNGSRDPGERGRKAAADQLFYQHDVESFKKQFDEAARATGTRWNVGGTLLEWVEWRHGRDLGLCAKEYNADTVDLRFWAERVV